MIKKLRAKKTYKSTQLNHMTPEERDFVRFKLELL